MKTRLREQHPEYAALLRRLHELERIPRNVMQLMPSRDLANLRAELTAIGEQLTAIELAFAHEVREASPFAIVCTDYELQIEQYGNGSGVEG